MSQATPSELKNAFPKLQIKTRKQYKKTLFRTGQSQIHSTSNYSSQSQFRIEKSELQTVKKDLSTLILNSINRKNKLVTLVENLNLWSTSSSGTSIPGNAVGSIIHGVDSISKKVRSSAVVRSPSNHRLGSPNFRVGSPSVHKNSSKEKGSKKRGSISLKIKKEESDLDEHFISTPQRRESVKSNNGPRRKKKASTKREREISDDDSDYSDYDKPHTKDSKNSTQRIAQNSVGNARGAYKKRMRSTTETVPKAEEDTPVIKLKDQVAIKTFYEYVEPYVRDYTDDDVNFLKEREDDVSLYIIPKLGRNYAEVWAEEECNLFPQTPEELEARHVDTVDGQRRTQESDIEGTCGPLTERLLAAFLEREEPVTVVASPGETQVNGNHNGGVNSPEGTQVNGYHPEAVEEHRDMFNMDERLKRELKALGIMDEEDVQWDEREDDEISIRLRELQEKLRQQVKINNYRKEVLLKKVKDRLAYVAYNNYLDETDSQIEECYLARFPEKDKNGKVSKTKKKKIAPTLEETRPILEQRKQLIESFSALFQSEDKYLFVPGRKIFNKEEESKL
ncbi:12715_t:CDS:2 [Acaulospora colombiana]|uniref:12715_t:CDS:1 n=1 Tax=Acaulospora colombiana TaxID=27376 RepID=A0ACA9L3S1_9GLOM|nr:12715_t:CDS:2 [Acaulospora colombiana]